MSIDRPPGRMGAAADALKDLSSTERKDLPFLHDPADAVGLVLEKVLTDAQQVAHASRP